MATTFTTSTDLGLKVGDIVSIPARVSFWTRLLVRLGLKKRKVVLYCVVDEIIV